MVQQFVAGFAAAAAFGVLYRVPAKNLFGAGMIGAIGLVVTVILNQHISNVVAVFLGSAVIALLSELWARRARQPVTLFLIPGIIPLVPGGQAYVTMLSFLRNDYGAGIGALVNTLFLSGAISGGVIVISSIFRMHNRNIPRIG